MRDLAADKHAHNLQALFLQVIQRVGVLTIKRHKQIGFPMLAPIASKFQVFLTFCFSLLEMFTDVIPAPINIAIYS